MKAAPRWLEPQALLLLHAEAIAQFGGALGTVDHARFSSALARPVDRLAYEPTSDFADLAAAYGFGLAKNHAFTDGNKRIAFLAILLFLKRNGLRFKATQIDAIRTIEGLAAGSVSESQLADWIRANTEG